MDDLCDAIKKQVAKGIEETHQIGIFGNIPVPEECPICLVTMSMENQETIFTSCCAKVMCRECDKKANDSLNGQLCPFCRMRRPSGRSEHLVAVRTLAKKGDANAAIALSDAYRNGDGVEASNYKSLKWALTAASHGSPTAYGIFSMAYLNGVIVEKSPLERRRCLEIAAKMGCIKARRTLETIAATEGDHLGAILHMEIAASAGCKVALTNCFEEYKRSGGITKSRLDEVLEHYKRNAEHE
jgi:hypothetical protein